MHNNWRKFNSFGERENRQTAEVQEDNRFLEW
jgi:hypothetical protein